MTLKNQKTLNDINKIVVFDGKTICGSDNIHNKALHILTAFDTDNELFLGQLPVDEKINEIKVMLDLIELLDLKDCVITADALNCQKEIVEKIIDKKGNYVLAIKSNKGELYEMVVDYFGEVELEKIKAKDELYYCSNEKAHSQIEVRKYFMVNDISYLKEVFGDDYKKLLSVGLCKKTTTNLNTNETTVEKNIILIAFLI